MHAYNPRQQKDLGKRKDFQMLRNLPDLPPPPQNTCFTSPSWLAAANSRVLRAGLAGTGPAIRLGAAVSGLALGTSGSCGALCLVLSMVLTACVSIPQDRSPVAGPVVPASTQPSDVILADYSDAGETSLASSQPSSDPAADLSTDTSLPQDLAEEVELVLLGPAVAELPQELPSLSTEAPSVHDPWEDFNRKIHRFNTTVDEAVAKPVAKAYVSVFPAPVRSKVGNFFDNLGQPATAVNTLLQGRVRHSAEALGRFLVNSTIGVAGLFDPAARMKMAGREEDFGQTLAHWGWKRSRYVELPFFGPSTIRDMLGMVGDSPLQPLAKVDADKVRMGLESLGMVDGRAGLVALDSIRDEAPDDYLLVRDSWSQRRNYQIQQDLKHPELLPDYLRD